jgi:hypothetical protein
MSETVYSLAVAIDLPRDTARRSNGGRKERHRDRTVQALGQAAVVSAAGRPTVPHVPNLLHAQSPKLPRPS